MRERQYTNEDIIDKLKEHPKLTAQKWDKEGIRPSSATILKRFGGWNKAREIADVPIHRETPHSKEQDSEYGKKYSREDILEALRNNPDIGATIWTREGYLPSLPTIIDRFGSWNEARRRAGLEVKKPFGGGETYPYFAKIIIIRRELNRGNTRVAQRFPTVFVDLNNSWVRETFYDLMEEEG